MTADDERVIEAVNALADEARPSADLWARAEERRAAHMRHRRNFTVLAAVASLLVIALVTGFLVTRRTTNGAHVSTQTDTSISQPATASTIASTSAPTTSMPAPTPSPLPAGAHLADLTWVSESHGWALTGNPTSVLETTDGAQTWTPIATLPPNTDVTHIRFASPTVGYLFGSDTEFFMSTDGGRTWNPQGGRPVFALEASTADVVRISFSHTGCPGPCDWAIERAAVGSNHWVALSIPSITRNVASELVRSGSNDLYVAFFANPAGGSSDAHAQLLVSHDGGDSWNDQPDPCGDTPDQGESDLTALAAAPNQVMAALCQVRVGASSMFVLVSTDGAQSVSSPRALPASDAFAAIAITTANDVHAASRHSVVTSHDGGASWRTGAKSSSSPDDARLFLGFETRLTGRWVATARSVWTTTDGGDSWREVAL